ncbi:hypothetical protein [Priestia megaterium]|uniref:hypothetical protein n=1 Tax=Priestia megaterium TaxID=1404 RepID=UPI001C30FF89|nr:hypothetical protein [Priestia megaterium]MCP1447034.1 NRPS condensation-like uncharacterized protein [Priestia megaterium]
MKRWMLNMGISVTVLITAWAVYTKSEEKEISLFSYDQPSIIVQKESTDFEKALKAFLTQHGFQEVRVLNNYAEAQILVLLPREHLSSHKKREIQQMVNQVAKQYHVHPDVVNVQLYEKK